jgi:hypothetical protein
MASIRAGIFDGDTWFERVRNAGASLLPRREGLDARVQYDVCDGDTHHRFAQVIADGQVAELRPGEVADADVEVQWELDDALAVLAGRVTGNEAMAVTTIVARRADGTYRGPPPPMDLVETRELAELPTRAGASLVVHQHLRGGPFGDVDFSQVFADGRLNRMLLGALADPDVALEGPYRTGMLVRQGTITPLEALEQGSISGSIGSLALFAGLLESDPFQRAQRACANRAGVALGTLGELETTPGYREAVVQATVAMVAK